MKEAMTLLENLEIRVTDKQQVKEGNTLRIASLKNQIEVLEKENETLEVEIALLVADIKSRKNEPEPAPELE